MGAIALRIALAAFAFLQTTSRFNDTIAAMASALAENNPEAFLKYVDKKMPGYELLKSNIEALVDQADVHSGIEKIIENGNEVTVEWEMRIHPHGDDPSVQSERRIETLHLSFAQDGKAWKLVGLDHIDFFGPPHVHKMANR